MRFPLHHMSIDPGSHTGWVAWAVTPGTSTVTIAQVGVGTPPYDILRTDRGQSRVILERPTIYPGSKAPASDIITLTLDVGRHMARCEDRGATVTLVEPRTWKGQTPKNIHERRIRAALLPGEEATVLAWLRDMHVAPSLQNNAWDAVGLGLYEFRGWRAN